MNAFILTICAVLGVLCLIIQYFRLDDRLDEWLAIKKTGGWAPSGDAPKTLPGDDGCWLDSAFLAAWCAAFVLFFIINTGGLL